MKGYSFKAILVFVITAWGAFFSTASTADAQRVHGNRQKGSGRLVIWRIPTLGNDVFVTLTIDGRSEASIGWGDHYDGMLSPGRHTISVQATPRPVYRDPWTMTLNVRPGQTYNFTAKSQSSVLALVRI
jgi:hypothetical protein